MLQTALTALIIAIIAAFLGFGGIANVATNFAVIVFYIAIALFVITSVVELIRRIPSRN